MKYFKYLKYLKNIIFKKYPLHVTIFVTSRCNFKCKVCFYHKSLNDNSGEFSLDQYQKVSKKMDDFFWLLISGGEPFLRSDLADICRVFCKNNIVKNITIPTNGWYADKIFETVKRILEENESVTLNVMVSLQGIGLVHENITGIPGSFNRALETIERLRELKKEHRNFFVGSVLTYSNANQDNFVELIDYLLMSGKVDSITAGLARGNARDKEMLKYNTDNFVVAMNKVLAAYQDKKIGYAKKGLDLFSRIYYLLYRDAVDVFHNNCWKNSCFAGTLNAVIAPNGDVFPCELIDKKIGNLREVDYDFKALWLSSSAREIRKKIKDSKCRCFHTCYTTTNIIFNTRRMFGVLASSLWRGIGPNKKWIIKNKSNSYKCQDQIKK